ncbi:glucose-dependent insulinotropic receptor isoform X2 [Papilio machaon]|uniref:glucose-dependent insulinotropic receptor isoform X2 n=1 Tax=Papilio machaon TaxID=76193 RepID=UPI001E665F80|nr:glucose-dependent insulinotropic receptor isoform X2 [Papilio machaon]
MSYNHSDYALTKLVMNFLSDDIYNYTNHSEVTQTHLFDLYEAYRTKEREQLSAYKSIAYVFGVVIFLSNLTVVISSGLIIKKGQQPKSTYLLLGNVSLADTIIGISIIFGASVETAASSNTLCIFQIGMLVCPAMVSIFSVGMIAVDRYIYILHGLYYQRWCNTTKVRIIIMCIWMISLFIASLPAMGWTGSTFRGYRCWYIAVFPPPLLIIVSLMALSVIIMVCVLYIIILRNAVQTVDRIREFQESHTVSYINEAFKYDEHINYPVHETSTTTITITISSQTVTELADNPNETHELAGVITEKNLSGKKTKNNFLKMSGQLRARAVNHPSKIKAVKTVFLILLCFVGTWTPYYIAIIIYVKCDITKNGYDCIPLEVLTLGPLYILCVSNSVCDPIIYAWRHSGFKKTLRKIYYKFLWNMRMLI